MEQEVTVTLAEPLYRWVKEVAQASQQSIEEAITDTIVRALPHLHMDPGRSDMVRETIAFRELLPGLLAQYEGQFVAIHQARVVDHDIDPVQLVSRIDTQYPDEVILVRQVVREPVETLYFRSPRLIL